jgi:hypothetical protein
VQLHQRIPPLGSGARRHQAMFTATIFLAAFAIFLELAEHAPTIEYMD